MYVQNINVINMCKRMFFGKQSECVLATTFWANDFKRGQEYEIDGRTYRVTRYARSKNPRFFDVLGYEVQPATALVTNGVTA